MTEGMKLAGAETHEQNSDENATTSIGHYTIGSDKLVELLQERQ